MQESLRAMRAYPRSDPTPPAQTDAAKASLTLGLEPTIVSSGSSARKS
jgi:hypothetical protein